MFGLGYAVSSFLNKLKVEVVLNTRDTFKLALPAGLYVIQNNLLFVALTNLDAATYQSFMLNVKPYPMVTLKKFSFVLYSYDQNFLKVAFTVVDKMVDQVMITSPSSVSQNSPTLQPALDSYQEDTINSAHPNVEVKWLLGVLAVFVSCISSGFAGVYFEALVKTESNTSLIIRNIQLGVFSLLFAGVAVYGDRIDIRKEGFFQGYSTSTWFVVTVQAFGGLIVSVTMKYADNILKGFATSISIVISTLISWILLGEKAPSFQFLLGASLVISATFIYSSSPDVVNSMVKGWQTFYADKKLRCKILFCVFLKTV
ncbi:UDP-N-acetylglucosamine transporter [Armadillidium nasatum]|uniref:UDP-N-acetylglucosamine transporter n=1 Tax=Armadillidium nasatum TaxID=96803 RepID=A0A5N5SV86_9CRUS|nr:UDP-N-acetylglucosamine transporter [Armadillidium nasatum]